ncbi:hypothetical protein [Alicyclobacillus fodiniaquatilis]|uniref:DUF3040 family protein n=1 Tax=Alicyclobacillus fodiniaquatilis TaxID=1661150 RepID=A0ABW4JII4_9BACL
MFQSENDMKEKEIIDQLRDLRLSSKNASTDERVLTALREQYTVNRPARRFYSWIPVALAGVAGLFLACGLVFVLHDKQVGRSNLTTASSQGQNSPQSNSHVHHGDRPTPSKSAPARGEPSKKNETVSRAPAPNNKTNPVPKSNPSPPPPNS